MKSLHDFCVWMNTGFYAKTPISVLESRQIFRILSKRFYEQTSTLATQKHFYPASASRMGKPILVTALAWVGVTLPTDSAHSNIATTRFLLGDWVEFYTLWKLAQYFGIPTDRIFREQEEYYFNGIVRCHLDFLEDLEFHGKTLLDIKSFGYPFKTFVKQPHNNYGYLTQLAIYREVTGAETCGFICFEKVSSKYEIVIPDPTALDHYAHVAKLQSDLLKKCTDYVQVIQAFAPPIPVALEAGNTTYWVPPVVIQDSYWEKIFYEGGLVFHKGKPYFNVSRVKPADEILEDVEKAIELGALSYEPPETT